MHIRFLLGVSLFLVVLLCLFVQVVMVVCWCVLILPVLILEGSEIVLGFLDLGLREFELGGKAPSMRFFGVFLGIILGHGFGRDSVSFVGDDDDAGGR